jgi:hypothetical protein
MHTNLKFKLNLRSSRRDLTRKSTNLNIENDSTPILQRPREPQPEIKMSDEQADIINQLKKGLNPRTVACAGAGKTTTIAFCASECPTEQVLALTFSRRLVDDTKKRIIKMDLKNIEAQTYHGFCTKYFGTCRNDSDMRKYLNSPPSSDRRRQELMRFTIIMLDELQDMNELYYKFMSNVRKYLNANIRIGLFGDPRQTIFEFNGGNPDYLMNPSKYWGVDFVPCLLSTTYRLSHKVTRVLNMLICAKYQLIGDPIFRMTSVDKPSDNPVDFHWIDIYKDGCKLIKSYINRYGHDSVLVMAPSIKNGDSISPVTQIMNDLRKQGIDMCTLTDDAPIDSDIIANKLVVSSIHKQKGCEQRCTIFVGLDCSYYKYFGNKSPLVNSLNVIYVGMSRPLEHLVLIGSNSHNYLPYWEPSEINRLVKNGDLRVHGAPQSAGHKCPFMPPCACQSPKGVSITNLLKYKSSSYLDDYVEQPSVSICRIEGELDSVASSGKITMGSGLVELVAPIYGILVPLAQEFSEYGKINMVERILSDDFLSDPDNENLPKHLRLDVRRNLHNLYDQLIKIKFDDVDSLIDMNTSLLAKISIHMMCYQSYEFPLYQIDNYEWVDSGYIKECVHRLIDFRGTLIGPSGSEDQIEVSIKKDVDVECVHKRVSGQFTLRGRVDNLINDEIIEYKLKTTFGDVTDVSQLLLYMWIRKCSKGYLYYPNLDQTMEVKILDEKGFDKFTVNWLGIILERYYHFLLVGETIVNSSGSNLYSLPTVVDSQDEVILPKLKACMC